MENATVLDIVLYQPEIPPNTGNIIRLCANTGFRLHLIEPLGFDLDHRKLRRAGLDYSEFDSLRTYPDWPTYRASKLDNTCYAFSTQGKKCYSSVKFGVGNSLLFGPETRGLPDTIREELGVQKVLKIPMRAYSRSLNMSNAVAIVAYEAWRQLGFKYGQLQ